MGVQKWTMLFQYEEESHRSLWGKCVRDTMLVSVMHSAKDRTPGLRRWLSW